MSKDNKQQTENKMIDMIKIENNSEPTNMSSSHTKKLVFKGHHQNNHTVIHISSPHKPVNTKIKPWNNIKNIAAAQANDTTSK